MSDLRMLDHAGARAAVGSGCYTLIDLAIEGAGSAEVKSTGAITYAIGGIFYTAAALSGQSIAVTHHADGSPVSVDNPAYEQDENTVAVYALALNAAGTLAVVQGAVGGAVPVLPNGYAPIGAIKVEVDEGGTFEASTTELDDGAITATYYNLAKLPAAL